MAQNPNIDDATRARAMKFAADKAPADKKRVVSKKELEESGLSLRDFLNKERGLTRRKSADDGGESVVKAQNAKIKKDTGLDAGEYMRTGKAEIDRQDSMSKAMSGYKPRGSAPLSEVVRPGTNTNYENDDTSDMTYKRGGKVKKMASGGSVSASRRGDGIASKGKTKGRMV